MLEMAGLGVMVGASVDLGDGTCVKVDISRLGFDEIVGVICGLFEHDMVNRKARSEKTSGILCNGYTPW